MSTQLAKKPALLLAQMTDLIRGLENYPDTFGDRQAGFVTNLTNSRDALQAALTNRTNAAGAAERATQQLYQLRDAAHLLTRQIRDLVYGIYTKYDARIVEFGLDTIRPRSGGGSNGSTNTPPDGGNNSGDTTQP
ncbi:MAG: hypothetical protein AUJ47_02435 [Candidatus Marinimicrobia bacterium CG1_02_48_14]|nr:MAG: hypothetical protein AUJ47_02435 [Candidatus Marinimicrobia bacterium CG1_02_48_14]